MMGLTPASRGVAGFQVERSDFQFVWSISVISTCLLPQVILTVSSSPYNHTSVYTTLQGITLTTCTCNRMLRPCLMDW